MKTFEEVFKEVFGETVAHARAREELYEVEAQEEVVFRSGGEFRSTNEELSRRCDNSTDGEEK